MISVGQGRNAVIGQHDDDPKNCRGKRPEQHQRHDRNQSRNDQ